MFLFFRGWGVGFFVCLFVGIGTLCVAQARLELGYLDDTAASASRVAKAAWFLKWPWRKKSNMQEYYN